MSSTDTHDLEIPYYERLCHCDHSLEEHRDAFGEWGKCKRKGCDCRKFDDDETWTMLFDPQHTLCSCGHEEDDHSPSRGTVCDLAFACNCTGFDPVE